jgi:hypothetical protein
MALCPAHPDGSRCCLQRRQWRHPKPPAGALHLGRLQFLSARRPLAIAFPANSGVIPLAFHVDYWDRLGWRDPFAQAAFSQRQRARNSGLGWVYTPQVMLDGEDFRSWKGGLPARLRAPVQVNLSLKINQMPTVIEAQVESRFVSSGAARDAQVYLALYENRLSSRVTAGENAQRTLRHDYVVRQLVGPLDPQRALYHFAVALGWQLANLGVTAFVLDAQGKTMQALMRPACS